MNLQEEIKEIICKALPDALVEVSDPMCDNTHFEATVVSESFNDLPLFKQHQLVMRALKEKFNTNLHALGLKTYSLKEWKERGRDLK